MLIRDFINWWRYDLQFSHKGLSFKAKVQGYIWIAILTFGFTCATQPDIAPNGSDVTGISSLAKAVGWPLFWSYQTFDWLLN